MVVVSVSRRTNSSRFRLEKNCQRLGLGRQTSRSRLGLGHLRLVPKTNFRPNCAGYINRTSQFCAPQQQQYSLYLSDEEVSGRGLDVLNDIRFSALRPLGRRFSLFQQGLQRVNESFSRVGLIMRPTRSRLSKANLSTLLFLNYNDKSQYQLYSSLATSRVCSRVEDYHHRHRADLYCYGARALTVS